MSRQRSPRGLIPGVLALALLVGVVFQASSAWAVTDGDSGSNGFFTEWTRTGTGTGNNDPGSGTGGDDGGEGDPDWWQTDVWTGSNMEARPAEETPRSGFYRPVVWTVGGPLGALVNWLLQLGSRVQAF